MNSASGPIVETEHVRLSDLGISMTSMLGSQNPTLASDCLAFVDAERKVNIIILDNAGTTTRVDTSAWPYADSVIIHTQRKYIALREQRTIRVFELQNEFSVSPSTLGFVTTNAVFTWSIPTAPSNPNAVVSGTFSLENDRIVDYIVTTNDNWHALVCHRRDRANVRNVNGVIQLFNRGGNAYQIIEGTAAAFLEVRLEGALSLTTLLVIADKCNGSSSLRVVKLERERGSPILAGSAFCVDFIESTAYDYPLAILPSSVDGIIHILTKRGVLHLYDILTGKLLHTAKISQVSMLLVTECNTTGGVICMNSIGNISSVSVNREVLVPYVLTALHEEKLAMQIARRADLPGAEYLFLEHFQQYMFSGEFKEAATLAANSPRGILRTALVIYRLKELPPTPGDCAPILHFLTLLSERGKLSGYESVELAQALNTLQGGGMRLVEQYLQEDKLECSKELGDVVRGQDMPLAVIIYKRAQAHGMAVKCLLEMGHFDDLHRYAGQVGFKLDHDMLQQIAQASVGEHAEQGHAIESLETRRDLTTPSPQVGGNDGADFKRETHGSMASVPESRSTEPRTVWTTVEQLRCLEFSALRDVLADIATIESLRVRALALGGRNAAIFNDLLQQCLTTIPEGDFRHPQLLRLLQDVCHASGELPSGYWLQGVTVNWRRCIGRGGEALAYLGVHEGQKVVARQISEPNSRGWLSPVSQDTLSLVRREIVTHHQLRHQNIIPLLGVFRETDEDSPMMILPFVENGSAVDYLKRAVSDDIHELTWKIILGLARALAYLHDRKPPVLHGDLHPGNVLVNTKGEAILCDFGFSRIRHDVTRTFTMIREGGRLRFLAPELSYGDLAFRTTPSSDVYSLAMTFFHLVTLSLPFAEHERELDAVRAAENGARPQRRELQNLPPSTAGAMWTLMERMWDHVPAERLSASDVQVYMDGILEIPV